MNTVIHPIPPLFNENCRILILGTMPSPKSRERAFYYMHTQNRFWPVLAVIFEEKLLYKNDGSMRFLTETEQKSSVQKETHNADIQSAVQERCALALRHGIALWDVLASCDIAGAEDSTIRNPIANSFTKIIKNAKIERIYCTGKTSLSLYKKLCEQKVTNYCIQKLHREPIPVFGLPSTSPANRGRYPFDLLVKEYSVLANSNSK
jgi:double-stranded uracil-DNA glycosylase